MSQHLPKELTKLVDWSVSELGQVILAELGATKFNRIEKIRRWVKSPQGQNLKGLQKLKEELSVLSSEEQYEIAHAFSLMLELINSCEAAYRTFRLKKEFQEEPPSVAQSYGRIIHVLTAHPTESRSPEIIYFFKKIQQILEDHLESAQSSQTTLLHQALTLAWHIPMSKQRKPSVMDEAEYIYSLALEEDILEIFVRQRELGQPFYIRTWVGGDKDGHPGVDEKAMWGSLQMSRRHLQTWVQKKLRTLSQELETLAHGVGTAKKEAQRLRESARKIQQQVRALRTLKNQDAKAILKLKNSLDEAAKKYKRAFHVESKELHAIRLLMKVFPALVVPLELREDSSLVRKALQEPAKKYAISRMLQALKKLSIDQDPKYYVRGFILSQTESAEDIQAGVHLVEKYLGSSRLPVVPLFESAHSLGACVSIVREFLNAGARRQIVKKNWSGKFEAMLGYSDSAKENGSFPSRYLIKSAVEKLEKEISSYGLTPIFFHGSGGSIERGGGSVQEQTEWWPLSALATVKVTVQGEMIYRNYTSAPILERQLQRFAATRDHRRSSKKRNAKLEQDLRRMADFVQKSYQEILQDPHFLTLIEEATPYSFLKDLRLGSRPSKRQGAVQLKNLRAIPWVLCWTQTRSLFPTWWGVGSFWQSLTAQEKRQYQRAYKESPLLSSYVKALGFTLEKMDLEVFALYLHSSRLPPEVTQSFLRKFKKEMQACQKAVREMTGQKSLLWYRPWLETSISLRSPLIHPLNVLQLVALKSRDIHLLRETVTGIASGMLTTG